MAMRLKLPYPPSANRYWAHVRGRVYVTNEARTYKEYVKAALRLKRINTIKKPNLISVSVMAYRPQKRGDLDNTLKVLFDALNKVAYDDDSQIVEIHAFRKDDKENPRVELELRVIK